MKPPHLWLTAPISSSPPSSFSELLLKREHRHGFAPHCPQPVWLISFAGGLSPSASLQRPQREAGPQPEPPHWLQRSHSQMMKTKQTQIQPVKLILISSLWLVIECTCHFLHPDYLESGVTFHRSRLPVTTAWTAASGLTPVVWDRGEMQSVRSVNRPGPLPAPIATLTPDIWSSGDQQLHRVFGIAPLVPGASTRAEESAGRNRKAFLGVNMQVWVKFPVEKGRQITRQWKRKPHKTCSPSGPQEWTLTLTHA